jgi:5-methyltetrahydropteroyltriglutamate--homocysteine methyltransferase
MARTAILGLGRIGPNRELKFAVEAFWAGRCDQDQLDEVARGLRTSAWENAWRTGIDVIPSGDFSLYDHVLDTAWALGAIPERFGDVDRQNLGAYFALARGTESQRPLEMTKWFDTNYHYLVPELRRGQTYAPQAHHWTQPLQESAARGIRTRPVMLGPFSFLLLSKGLERPLDALDELVPAYQQLLRELAEAGASEVQIDEPCLVLDRTAWELDAFAEAWAALESAADVNLCLATYFDGLDGAGSLDRVLGLTMSELHLDLVRGPGQLRPALDGLRDRSTRLSLGVIDGRNVWASDLDGALDLLDTAQAALGPDRITIAPSCSFLHVPYDASREDGIDPSIRLWLAFASEKIAELRTLADALDVDPAVRARLLDSSREVVAARRASPHTTDPEVRERVRMLKPADYARSAAASSRHAAQRARLRLPDLPTTTIGSFPQTSEIRSMRRRLRTGKIDQAAYDEFLEAEIGRVIETQERLGLDVLVHGEPERADMVEYFGQQLRGFVFSEFGWVQSYGSRCVKPPILYGDVSRPAPMTVRWWRHAQSLTEKPVKGMLTGPVTILQWSFVRDDQPREETCRQLALAMRDEVVDLERAGAQAIQVDEAAFREGLPLQRGAQDSYLRWAVDCFRLTVAPAGEGTQIHTHMCYSEFNEVIDHIARLDADVISIEASRSGMEVLDVFDGRVRGINDIGPGLYDIHSPRVPSVEEMDRLLALAEGRVGRERLWANPDCGLKTRRWEEALPALEHLVAAARERRGAPAAVSAGGSRPG